MFFSIPMFVTSTTCFRGRPRTTLDDDSSKAKCQSETLDETDVCSTWTEQEGRKNQVEDDSLNSSAAEPMRLIPFCSLELRSTTQSWSTLEAGALQLEETSRNNNDNDNDDLLWWGMDADGCFVPTSIRSFEEEEEEDKEETLPVHAKVLRDPDIPTEIEVCVVVEQEQEKTWIFDAVEPLIQGRLPLEKDNPLQLAANQLEDCLQKHLNDSPSCTTGTSTTMQRAYHTLQRYPEAAQVRYRPPSEEHHSLHLSSSPCYPLTFFCAMGNLEGMEVAYNAYPEAMGHADHWLGTPLHYACYHGVDAQVVQFLLTKYPEAARTTNDHYQSPLHLACACPSLNTGRVIELLLEVFPGAAQLADQDGMTPLHWACSSCYGANPCTDILQALTTSGVIRSLTRTMETPLHVAARNGAAIEMVAFLIAQDPSTAACLDQDLQTPLHKATAFCPTVSLDLVQVFVHAYHGATECRDAHDERPYDLALRMKSASPAVLELLGTTRRNEYFVYS
jgi:hypothetical protein